jgi:hypothetical protein
MSTTGPADSAGISAEDFEGGARRAGRLAAFVCIFWSLFQLWVASDFPFYLSEVTGLKLVFNNQEARQIHLAFGLGLALSLYPAVRSVHPLLDRIVGWGLAAIGVAACLYLFVFKLDIANRAGLPNRYDLFFSIAGMLCVMAAVYRALGLPLLVVAMVFIIYVMFGHLDVFPDAMRWKGASLNKATWHFWMQTEGVFGVALGVSASMIFLFVLFGALLESAGAGNYFIKLSFAALGHLRGGPAKAAVVASGLSGIYSGSSIANVVTTGTFTIRVDEEDRPQRREGRRGGGGVLDERTADAAGDGRGRLPHRRVHRHQLFRADQACGAAGAGLLCRAVLHRPYRGDEAWPDRPAAPDADAGAASPRHRFSCRVCRAGVYRGTVPSRGLAGG